MSADYASATINNMDSQFIALPVQDAIGNPPLAAPGGPRLQMRNGMIGAAQYADPVTPPERAAQIAMDHTPAVSSFGVPMQWQTSTGTFAAVAGTLDSFIITTGDTLSAAVEPPQLMTDIQVGNSILVQNVAGPADAVAVLEGNVFIVATKGSTSITFDAPGAGAVVSWTGVTADVLRV